MCIEWFLIGFFTGFNGIAAISLLYGRVIINKLYEDARVDAEERPKKVNWRDR